MYIPVGTGLPSSAVPSHIRTLSGAASIFVAIFLTRLPASSNTATDNTYPLPGKLVLMLRISSNPSESGVILEDEKYYLFITQRKL